MERTHSTYQIGLMPNYFKKIGACVIILSIVLAAIGKAFQSEMPVSSMYLFKDVIASVFILGLFFLAWAKDKVEDELTTQLRLKAIAWSFAWGVLSVTIGPFIEFLMVDSFKIGSGRQVIFTMLFIYLMVFNMRKITIQKSLIR